jgi:hypothetical protein
MPAPTYGEWILIFWFLQGLVRCTCCNFFHSVVFSISRPSFCQCRCSSNMPIGFSWDCCRRVVWSTQNPSLWLSRVCSQLIGCGKHQSRVWTVFLVHQSFCRYWSHTVDHSDETDIWLLKTW